MDYLSKDNNALLLNIRKNKNLHNYGHNRIHNYSHEGINNYVRNDIIDTHGKNFYLNFFNSDIPPIQKLYNQYLSNNGMKIFIPVTMNPYRIIYIINTYGPEYANYVIYNDCILPNFLSYEDKLTLSQLPP